MANSYGFNDPVPEWAEYGIYDTENGEWIGQFFPTLEEAQKAANEFDEEDNERLCMMSTTDETVIL